MISTSLLPISKYSLPLGVMIMCSYEYFLTKLDGTSYMLNAARVNLISSNREGIFGALGFLSLYCVTVTLGSHFVWRLNKSKQKKKNMIFVVRDLFTLSASLWVMYALSDIYISSASRRMVNMTYVIWVLAQNFFMLGLFALVQHVLIEANLGLPNSKVLENLSRNTLYVFLISNILTGLVNLSMDTIESSEMQGFFIVSVYMALVFLFAGLAF